MEFGVLGPPGEVADQRVFFGGRVANGELGDQFADFGGAADVVFCGHGLDEKDDCEDGDQEGEQGAEAEVQHGHGVVIGGLGFAGLLVEVFKRVSDVFHVLGTALGIDGSGKLEGEFAVAVDGGFKRVGHLMEFRIDSG